MSSLPGMIPFFERFPELFKRETRVITLPQGARGLAAGKYAFVELFCNDPGCDCRRVVIQVWPDPAGEPTLATINFGWERESFYARKFDIKAAREIKSACLDPLNEQSEHAELLLAIFRDVVKNDPAYVQRLARHYKLFKEADESGHPG